MRFFLDENFPASAKLQLEALGHEVVRAVENYPQGTDDFTLFAHAQSERAIFLTTDKDFFHTVPFVYPDRTAAVVAITLNRPNRERILQRLKVLLDSVDLASESTGILRRT